ncbi:MAG: sel1 repeat family protein, partial [Myxococcales bacterium]|nr:sel1 repeat family protein [Myxococcales bacterium]
MTVLGLGLSGCAVAPVVTPCPRGQQQHEGQCIPTSSLVFERCLETFRKTKVERAHGVDTEVTAQVEGQGASFHRARTDTEQAEYDGLPDALMGEAIDECRRQEQQQRSLELERAWAAADEADRRADEADQQARAALGAQREAEDAAQRHEQARVELAQEVDALRLALGEAEGAVQREHARLVELHPCTAQAWDRCGEEALAAKRAGDYALAHDKYRLACEGGSAEACANWGVMFEHGLGVGADPMEAHRLYERACEQEDAHACVNLGFLYEQGQGVARSLDRAVALYDAACTAGQLRGCGRLGRLVATEAVPPVGLPSAASLLDR